MAEEQQTLTRAEKKAQKKAEIKKKRLEANKKPRLFPANKRGKHVMPFLNLFHVLAMPLHFLLFPYKLHGHKKVKDGACIYVGNHYSMFDVFYPLRTTWEGIHYICKQSILEAPVLWKWGIWIGAIGAARDGSDVRTVMESVRILKADEKICMFPEGTRNRTEGDEFLPFRGGAALLSVKTKTPIVPFVIVNRPRLFRRTHVVFGEPMEFTEFYDKKPTSEDYDRAEARLLARLYELREEFRASRKRKEGKK